MSDRPDFSICLLTYNRRAQLVLRWNELWGLYGHRPDVEFCVLDNGSTDGTRELLAGLAGVAHDPPSAWKVVYKSLPENIAMQGWNELVAMSSAPTFVWLCDDVRVFGDILTPMVAVIEATGGLAVVCNHDVLNPYTWNEFAQGKVMIPYLEMDICAMRREVWDDVGELDPRFKLLSYQDVDWCHRAQLKGYVLRGIMRPDGSSILPVEHRSLSGQNPEHTIINRAIFAEKWGLHNSPERP
jgi:GT2 family glycosyltransferase